jgi:hypothetical protein
MKFFILRSRPNRRSLLRDLHAFGIVSVFRRHSIFRIWEPLREEASASSLAEVRCQTSDVRERNRNSEAEQRQRWGGTD